MRERNKAHKRGTGQRLKDESRILSLPPNDSAMLGRIRADAHKAPVQGVERQQLLLGLLRERLLLARQLI
jgi:hypothetical protein